jgi:hypothetical protein
LVSYSFSPCSEKEGRDSDGVSVQYLELRLSQFAAAFLKEITWRMEWMERRIETNAEKLYGHMNEGHIPPIQGAGKMNRALEILGLSEDYDARRKVI